MVDSRNSRAEIAAVLKKHGPMTVLEVVAEHLEKIDEDKFGHLAEGINIIAKDVGEKMKKP